MLTLNDDCLGQIFQYLQLEDQLSLTDVCGRFRDVMLLIVWRNRYRNSPLRTDTSDLRKFSLEQFQKFFSVISMVIERLVIADTKSEAFTSYLGRYGYRPDLDFYLTLQYPMLKSLECECGRIHDGHVRIIADRCPQLTTLRVSSSHVTGAYIRDITSLRELHARQCGLEREHLHNLLSQLKDLQVLDVIDNPHCPLSLSGLQTSSLVELRLSEAAVTNVLVEHLHNLTKLRLLHVNNLLQGPNANGAWQGFMEQFGCRICQLDLYNTRLYTSIVNALPLDWFKQLEELKVRCSPNMEHLTCYLTIPCLKTLNIEMRLFESDYLKIVEKSPYVNRYQLEGLCFSKKNFEEMIPKLIGHLTLLRINAKRPEGKVTLRIQEPLDDGFQQRLKEVIESDEYNNQNILDVQFFRKPLEIMLPMTSYVQFTLHQAS